MKTTIAIISLSAILACLTLSAQEPAQIPPKPKAGSRLMEMFQELDKNGDGKLTREEGRSLTNFGEMDTDKDGFLTPQEIGTFYAPKNKSPIPPSLLKRDAIENDKTPPFPSPDGFKPDDVPVGDPAVSYNDPEFLPGGQRMVFVDQWSRRIWVAELDPATGLTRTKTGQDILAGENWAPFKHSQNGPEWCLDRQGPAVTFTVLDEQGVPQLALTRLGAKGAEPVQRLTSGPQRNFSPFGTLWAADASTRLAYAHGGREYADYHVRVLDVGRPEKTFDLPYYWVGSSAPRWLHGTTRIIYPRLVKSNPNQIEIAEFDFATGKAAVLTDDGGSKDEVWGFFAPEYDGEVLYAAQLDNKEIAIYRDLKDRGGLLTKIATLKLPANSPHSFMRSMEPLVSLRGAGGVSYFTVLAAPTPKTYARTDTSIWVLGLGKAPQHRIVRRVDDGGVPMKTFLDLPYAKFEGVEPKLTSLDLYAPPNATNAPILVWVHGGGWARGDKSQVASLPAAFVREGFVVASVNYRLAPAVKFDAQAQDVAAAIAWLRKHAKDYGAAPEKMFLMGHSAGAHLVALVGTDESYLKAHGLSLSALRGVVPLDTEAYDLKGFAARFGGKLPELYASPFTQDPATWAKASPATHVAKGKSIPPMILAYSGGQKPNSNPSRKTDAEEFVGKLRAAGVTGEVIAAPEKTHMQIALEFGTSNDQVAAKVFAFLKTILGVSAVPPSSAGFTPDDVRMGDAQFAYIDPEFLQSEGRAVFLDSSLNIWVGEIDPATGLFRSASGRDQRVDTGISQWSRYSNGPEWGLDAKGPALFYVKDNAQGAGQLWRAEPPWDKPRLAQLTHDTDIHNWLCEPSVNPALPSTRVIVYHGKPRAQGNVDAWLDEDKPDQLKPFTDRMIVARWAYNTNLITFAYRARAGQTEPSQVTLVDTDTGKSRIITADAGNKIDPWLWQAPELGGEVLLCANTDSHALGIYRDVKRDGSPWQRIATLRLPADAPHQTLKSVEPVNGGRGAFGKSYFTVQAGDDKVKDTSIWLFGFSPDGQHLIRRLDDGAQTGKPARRLDPESYIGERELFVYYTLVGDGPSQSHRCRTGISKERP